jgi:hypothetical protein
VTHRSAQFKTATPEAQGKDSATLAGLIDFGAFATKWLNDSTFEIERQVVGMDELQKLVLAFDGDRPQLRAKDRDGREVSIEGEPGP